MDIDHISECQAKDILCQLAKKSRFDHIVFHNATVNSAIVLCANKEGRSPLYVDDQSCMLYINTCHDIHKAVLAKMLIASTQGHDIVAYDVCNDVCNDGIGTIIKRVFFPKNMSFEEMMINLDLERQSYARH